MKIQTVFGALCVFFLIVSGCSDGSEAPNHQAKHTPADVIHDAPRVVSVDQLAAPKGVSEKQWASILDQIESTRHQFKPNKKRWTFERAAQRWQGSVDERGELHLMGRQGSTQQLSWRLSAWGRASSMQAVGLPESVDATANRLRFQHGHLTAWFKHTRHSLMQGFDVSKRPEGSGALEVQLGVGDGWVLRESGAHVMIHHTAQPGRAWRYGQLAAWDRDGTPLNARMRVDGERRVSLVVDDAHAQYPVTIDPIFESVDRVQRVVPATENLNSVEFGASVAMFDGWLAIGAPNARHPETGMVTGGVFLYKKENGFWRLHQRINPSNVIDAQSFGASLLMSSEYLLVGEPNATSRQTSQGQVAVYSRFGQIWSFSDTVQAPTPQANELFGSSMAFNGSDLVIGAPGTTNSNGSTGSVYLFEDGGEGFFTPTGTQITPTDAEGRGYGKALAFEGDALAVGAPDSTIQAVGTAGAVYVHRYDAAMDQWMLDVRLTQPTLTESAFFGSSLSMVSTTLLIGAPGHPSASNAMVRVGAAFVHERDTNGANAWGLEKILRSPNPQEGDQFGGHVLLSITRAFVGSVSDRGNIPAERFGAVYLFEKNKLGTSQWGLTQRFSAPDGISGDSFGVQFAFDDRELVVGARGSAYGDVGAGAAYHFTEPVNANIFWDFRDKFGVEKSLLGDGYGYSVAIDQDWMVVGAPFEQGSSFEAGRVYLFQRDINVNARQWRYHSTLNDPAGDRTRGHFGFSVAIHDGRLAVGSPLIGGVGRVVLFSASSMMPVTWSQTQDYFSSMSEQDDLFGHDVALSDDLLVIGRPGSVGMCPAGCVEVVARGANDDWVDQTMLPPPAGSVTGMEIGFSVAVDSNSGFVVAGAPSTALSSRQGDVYVYDKSTGSWESVALTRTLNIGAKFGYDVATNNTFIAVTAPESTNMGNVRAGRVMLYQKNGMTWDRMGGFTSNTANQYFGKAVVMSDTVMAVSGVLPAPLVRLYEFENGTWSAANIPNLTAPRGEPQFGRALAMDDDQLIVGAYEESTAGVGGVAYQFGIDVPVRPSVNNVTIELNEDTPTSVQLLAYPAGAGYTFRALTMPQKADQFSLSAAGLVMYTPQADVFGTDYLLYEATHPTRGDSNYGMVVFSINPQFDAIVAPGQNEVVEPDITTTFPLNFRNPDNVPVTFTVDLETNCTVAIDAMGIASFTPQAGFTGAASFRYIIEDVSRQQSITGNVSVSVEKAMAPPVFLGVTMNQTIDFVAGQKKTLSFDFDSFDPEPNVTFTGFGATTPEQEIIPNGDTYTLLLAWEPDFQDVLAGSRMVRLTLANVAGMASVDFTVSISHPGVEIASPNTANAVAEDVVRVTGQAVAGGDVTLTLTGAQTYTTTATPGEDGAFTADLTDVANGSYTLEAAQGSETFTVAVTVAALGVDMDPTVEGGTKDGDVIVAPEGEPVIISGVLPENSDVTVTLTDKDGNSKTFGVADGVELLPEQGIWRFELPDEYIGQEIDVTVVITNRDTMKKATMRFKVRSSRYNPDAFLRDGCQSTHGQPLQLWPLLLMCLLVAGRRRREQRR